MPASPFTVYSTTWCGDCRRLKSGLSRAGVSYTEVDIEQEPGAAEYVERLNGGFQSVPTVVFTDGTVMTEPSSQQVLAHLAAMESH